MRRVETRLSEGEHADVAAAAVRAGLTVSAYLRRLVQRTVPRNCPECKGVGYVMVGKAGGYSSMSMSMRSCSHGCPGPLGLTLANTG